MVTNEQLQRFCDAVQEMRREYFEKHGYNLQQLGTVEFMCGPKYARIVKVEPGQGRSAYCFVDLSNGNILKQAGWSAPAKHARGNIANGASEVGPYGAAYLR